MLINLAFIKAANGLFHYALDYLAALNRPGDVVLVRSPALARIVERRFPALRVRIMGGRRAALAVWAAGRRGEMVFTPSPHPIPWCDRQMVVVHDSFPFDGPKGRIKAALFFAALRTSGTTAGYINLSDARAFLLAGGLDPARLRSSPNRMAPPATAPLKGVATIGKRAVIGLFGTDSPKKNYERLFAALASQPDRGDLAFRLYGQPGPYADGILAAFPMLDIALVDSGSVELDSFIRSVDLVAAAATREGFSRPTALALSLGVPCWIVEAPVFREFYDPGAVFHADVEALATALAALTPGTTLERPVFALPAALQQDFEQCIAWLQSQDTCRW